MRSGIAEVSHGGNLGKEITVGKTGRSFACQSVGLIDKAFWGLGRAVSEELEIGSMGETLVVRRGSDAKIATTDGIAILSLAPNLEQSQ